MKPNKQFSDATIQRFWSYVDKRGPDDCWEWNRATWLGYGRFNCEGQKFRAHRFAYLISVGDIPPDLVVRHRCNNRSCVNPAHLVVGTHRDNIYDQIRSGTLARGERCASAKLTAADVLKIHQLHGRGMSFSQIAGLFNVAVPTVAQIFTGRTWKHVVPPNRVRQLTLF